MSIRDSNVCLCMIIRGSYNKQINIPYTQDDPEVVSQIPWDTGVVKSVHSMGY